MLPQKVIQKKRDNGILNQEEIDIFVKGLTNESFSDSQIASMSMAIFLNGMSKEETVMLTNAMTNSGDILNWENELNTELVCDKHSTGGVGDKVSLILAPILAACGLYVPMISGRGLGHTGGTLDKFDSIPGYNTNPSIDEFKRVVKNVGCAVIGQTANLAPADKKLYSVRDIVGTVESIPLITSSILSKKIAAGLKNLILDVKVGNGSFNANVEIASNLAISLVEVAKGAGLKCEAILSDMNQVLGWNVGHTLEVEECIKYLTSTKKNPRLEKITNELASSALKMCKNINKQDALHQIEEVVNNGTAAEKFEKMISALGGPNNFLQTYDKLLLRTKKIYSIFSDKEGFVHSINTKELGLILIELGGGRKQINDKINYSIGFENVVNIGDKVDTSTELLKIHVSSENELEKVKKRIYLCFNIKTEQTQLTETIYQSVK
ncbi:MAG: Thymidine phosphorylase [Alphaproteobacteria bacterium MarineAlpha5_Bin11]|nr:thymidine phosphorylase [Pelagibacteraceae bacterium]PPR44569.1 MAG: Thymidine phosphorylase [Alphaproteobacteria bacterium MarineAlpha5_Bin11]PPR50865.1 MAG: Thymidine phosphorylase [Alphaproteobacteria bacterium MarineAlpha5_Bin10]|tara:strand:+ start:6584 stop:7897 length:1314 start_codon:yes stop_codon:yes gene_type:complete